MDIFKTIKESQDLKEIADLLQKIPKGKKRTVFLHKLIDTFFENSKVAKEISRASCCEGCADCCYYTIVATEDEISYILNGLEQNFQIDYDRLRIQKDYLANKNSDWNQLEKEYRKCVFLGVGNKCQVYNRRPMACRAFYSISEPSLCGLVGKNHNSIQVLEFRYIKTIMKTIYTTDVLSGYMPQLLCRMLRSNSSNPPRDCERDKVLL